MRLRIVPPMLALALAVWALMQTPAPPQTLARYFPPDALLYLEARDFASLVRDWNGAPEKKLWLGSANFDVFSRSRLYLRLSEAHAEFAAAAGLPPDMALVAEVAGAESALAIYDIGRLEFLYISKLASTRAVETALWRTRTSYESRNAAGTPYFVRLDKASRRVAAFATAGDYLLIATREDLIAGALALLAGRGGATIQGQQWFDQASRAAAAPGDLRLVFDMTALIRSPHFRSYWIQRNVSMLRQYSAGIVDLRRSPAEIREERALLRADRNTAAPESGDSLAQVLRLAPDDAGLYRAWALPSAADATALVRTKIAPRSAAAPAPLFAPTVATGAAAYGSEADLETRIDEPPLAQRDSEALPRELRALFEKAGLKAMLAVDQSRRRPGGIFIALDSAVALLGSSDWNAAAVRSALAASSEIGPLGRATVETRGPLLIVANSSALAKRIAARAAAAPAPQQPGTYFAGFRHSRERANFYALSRMIEYPSLQPENNEPPFLSGNIASLSRALARVESSSIEVRDTGAALFQTVLYRIARP